MARTKTIGESRNRIQEPESQNGHGDGQDPPINHPEAVAPPLPENVRVMDVPPALLQALTSTPDPYALLGREYARRVQLEGIVSAFQDWLKGLVGEHR